MIRPLTIASCLLACGSGLYLYQEKHEVQLLDRTIERTVHDTAALREQSRLLAAEWTMLNDPERLRQFADTYLRLKTISPSQFTSLADLDGRLPPSLPEATAQGDEEQGAMPMAAETVPFGAADPVPAAGPAAEAPTAVLDDILPVPPIPALPRGPAVATAAHPGEPRTLDRVAAQRTVAIESQTRPSVVANSRPLDQRPGELRLPDRPPIQQSMAAEGPAHPASLDARPQDQRSGELRLPDRPPIQRLTAADGAARPATLDARPPGQRPGELRLPDRPPIQHAMAADGLPRPAAVADARPVDPSAADTRVQGRPPIQRSMAPDGQSRSAVLADGRPSDQRPPEQHTTPRLADARAETRLPFVPPPRPIVLAPSRPPLPPNGPVSGPPPIEPLRPPVVAASAPYGGSLLGMARDSVPPAPRPTPVNATYNSN